jgi:hypothetical protein
LRVSWTDKPAILPLRATRLPPGSLETERKSSGVARVSGLLPFIPCKTDFCFSYSSSKFILVEGPLQNQDNVIHIKATRLENLAAGELEVRSHDFH